MPWSDMICSCGILRPDVARVLFASIPSGAADIADARARVSAAMYGPGRVTSVSAHTLWLKHAEMVQPTIPTSDIFIGFSNAEWLRIARWFKPFLATQSGFALKNAKFSHQRADIVEFVRPLCKVLFHSCTLSCCHAENLVNAYIELQDFLLCEHWCCQE